MGQPKPLSPTTPPPHPPTPWSFVLSRAGFDISRPGLKLVSSGFELAGLGFKLGGRGFEFLSEQSQNGRWVTTPWGADETFIWEARSVFVFAQIFAMGVNQESGVGLEHSDQGLTDLCIVVLSHGVCSLYILLCSKLAFSFPSMFTWCSKPWGLLSQYIYIAFEALVLVFFVVLHGVQPSGFMCSKP